MKYNGMKYDNTFGEGEKVMNDPTMADFRKRVLSKPNGSEMLDSYIKLKGDLDYDEARFKGFSPDYPYYDNLKASLEEKRKRLAEAEEMLNAPPTFLQKVMAAPKIVTDPFEKGIDVLKNWLSSPEPDTQGESQKPSLWEVFFK